MADAFDQWSTARPFLSNLPQWAPPADQARIAAYSFYEQMFWNVPESFKLIQRGADAKPIYIPASKVIVNTLARYVAPGMAFLPDPELGSTTEQEALSLQWKMFSRRERFQGNFNSNKRYGIIRGDWLWHIVADPEREEGAQVSLYPLDPGSVFKITMEDDVDVIIGYHIVDQIIDAQGKPTIYRLTYRKETERGGPSPIIVSEDVFEVDAWGGPDMSEKRVRSIRAEERLPDPIDQLPIYHIKNFSEPLSEWGSSELRGMERLIAAINQSISDEELELVLNGLGVYATDAGAPRDAENNPTTWNLGPGKVVELPNGKKFERVNAVQSVTPHQDHLKYLHEQLDLAAATPAIAKGKVDVQVAESGIALLLELAPIIAVAEEKEADISDVHTNLQWDLKKWWAAYDGISLSEVAALVPVYGDRVPVNRKQRFTEIMEMLAANLVSAKWARAELEKIGYEFGDDTAMLNDILLEKEALSQVESDVTGSRMDRDLDAEDDPAEDDPVA